jgi:hypothetical protein
MRIFIALLISAALAAANPLVFLSGSPSSGAAVGGLYTFEETGACAGWVDASTNETSTVNWDYSTSPLDGSQSLFLADSTTDDRIAKYDFTEDADEIWIAFRFREWANPAIESQNIGIEDSAGANLASVMVSTGGNLAFEVTTANSGTVAFLTGGSSYRVKIRYLKGTLNTETMQVWAVAEGLGIVENRSDSFKRHINKSGRYCYLPQPRQPKQRCHY